MTTSESIVVSQSMAQRLREAGWPDVGAIHWWMEIISPTHKDFPGSGGKSWKLRIERERDETPFKFISQCIAAPTAEEILRKLPTHLVVEGTGKNGGKGNKFYPQMTKWRDQNGDLYLMRYHRSGSPTTLKGSEVQERSFANACAALYCFIAENGLLPKV